MTWNWNDFKLRMITGLAIKLLCLIVMVVGLILYFLAVQLTDNVFYIADLVIGLPFIVVPAVTMAVGTIYAHVSLGFCHWFWERVASRITP